MNRHSIGIRSARLEGKGPKARLALQAPTARKVPRASKDFQVLTVLTVLTVPRVRRDLRVLTVLTVPRVRRDLRVLTVLTVPTALPARRGRKGRKGLKDRQEPTAPHRGSLARRSGR